MADKKITADKCNSIFGDYYEIVHLLCYSLILLLLHYIAPDRPLLDVILVAYTTYVFGILFGKMVGIWIQNKNN